jgi:metallo-beta-lactamase class B
MRLLAGLVVVLASLAGTASAQSVTDFLKSVMANWTKPTEPFKVIDNIYYVGTNGLAVYLITTPQGHILVDTGVPEVTGQIRDSIQKLGFKIADIKYILNTQAHLDHTGGFAELKKESGAQLIVGERDKPLIEGGYYPGQESTAELKFPPATVDRAVKDGETVSLGGVTITAHDTPGHTPGCTSWSLNVKDGNDTRSVIMFCSASIALNKLVGNPTYPGIIDDYRKTFAWARTYKADVFLAPHPEMYGMEEKRAKITATGPNPFVDPAGFNTYVAGLEKAFDEGLAKQTAEAESKK